MPGTPHAIDSMMDTKDNNNYFTLPNQLRARGYTSIAFHNGSHASRVCWRS